MGLAASPANPADAKRRAKAGPAIPLYFRPGRITQEFLASRRIRFVLPFRLFFVLTVICFLVAQLVLESGSSTEILIGSPGSGGPPDPDGRCHHQSGVGLSRFEYTRCQDDTREGAVTGPDIDDRIYDLYDEYCHGGMDRREFLRRASVLTVGGLAMAQALLPRYVSAQVVSFTDERIGPRYVTYPSPGGNSGEMRGYLVQPEGGGPFPAVLVVHENRGLNPHIEDVARRAAVEGFLALAPDGLYPAGGYPGNDDDGRALQRSLDQDKLRRDMVNSARFIESHELSNGKLGVVGFCWGGGIANHLAVTLGDDLQAAVPFYGAAAPTDQVSRIRAAVMVQAAENDPRVNALWPDYEAALKTHDVDYQHHLYPGTRHGFHNNSTPRYDEAAAKLAWQRTMSFFRQHLAG